MLADPWCTPRYLSPEKATFELLSLFCQTPFILLVHYAPALGICAIYFMSLFNMASFQRVIISTLLILTAVFLLMAKNVAATRGPKITQKVHS